MYRGYIKLWRKSEDSRVFKDPELWKLWCLCLMKATHKEVWVPVDGQKDPILLTPGQFITGRDSLWREYYPKKVSSMKSPKTIWRWMQILKNMQNLDINSSNKFSIVSIMNWHIYQPSETESVQQSVQQMSNRCPTDVQQMSTYKNVKNKQECIRNPPTPQNGGNGNGEKHKQALELYSSYIELLKPTPDHRSRSRCISNLVYYLDHFSFEVLQKSIERYADSKKDSERIFIKDPANFFGKKDPVFSDYMETQEANGWTLK
jgi:hypothetical protein